jgi:LysM repeat protein
MAKYYIVKTGDTLWAISRRFNTTVENLVRLNYIDNPDCIRVGQRLRIE